MAISDFANKYELECLRLASDCMQLAGIIDVPASQLDFIAMARAWTAKAEAGPPRISNQS
jgi:hypothetical protein